VHATVGFALAEVVQITVTDAARATLLPLAGVFVGMSFAWVGSAQAISQSIEVDALAKRNPAGFESYVYPFQLAILGMLVALGAWGLAALGVFDQHCFWQCPAWSYTALEAVLYGLACLVLRLCWQVVLGSQMLLLYQRAVSTIPSRRREMGDPPEA
jgi:hypothetical protein